VRINLFGRTIMGLAATALAVSAVSIMVPVRAAAEPPAPKDVAPTTTVTPVDIPVASTRQKQVHRRQADTSAAPGRTLLAELPEHSTERFSTVGVTWRPTAGSATATVEVRTKPVAGTWTDWVVLENEVGESPADAARVGTAPVYVGDSDGVQVRISTDEGATTLPGLQLSVIDSPEVKSDANPATSPATAAAQADSLPYLYPQPSIVTRAGWGADESWRTINGSDCATPDIDDTIQGGVVHHTAGSNTYSASQSASIVRGVYAYHVKTQGWCDIGYNFLVDKYGKVFEGRAGGVNLPVHGAHATSWNTNTVGISVMGNYDSATPSSTVLDTVAKVLAWKLEGYYRNAQGRVTLASKNVNVIFTHGDVMSTGCPGTKLQAKLPDIRNRVASKIGSYNTPIFGKWNSLGGESGFVGSPHIGEARISNGRYTQFTGASLYYKPELGSFYVKGDIRTKYDAAKATSSALGWPTSDQLVGAKSGNRVSRFQHGRIYWSGTTKAHPVQGGIKYGYYANGEDGGRLGLPTADEGKGVISGSYQQKFVGGAIMWSSATKAQPLWGGIGKRYLTFSTGAQKLIGLPIAPEGYAKVPGAYVQRFQTGAVYWHGGVGYGLHSQIWTRYSGLGAEAGRLGLPTSHNTTTSTGETARFEHGRIDWNRSTGQVTVTYSS